MKSRSKQKHKQKSFQRDHASITTENSVLENVLENQIPLHENLQVLPPRQYPIQSDRRLFNQRNQALTVFGTHAVIKAKDQKIKRRGRALFSTRFAFQQPLNTWVCIRRKERRRNVFAFVSRQSGKGARGMLRRLARLPRHYNEFSQVRC